MSQYLARRIASFVAMIAVAVIATFIANRFVPGDPVLVMLGDQSSNLDLAARLRADYGLDLPLHEQFVRYVTGLLRGDLGLSFRFPGVPVGEVIADGLRISPVIGLAALVLSLTLGTLLGAIAAVRAGSLVDTGLMFVVVIGLSVPGFVVATGLVWLLSVRLGWLPVAGWGTPQQAILPIIVAAIGPIAYFARLTRTFLLETLGQDYVRTARAKGVPERGVVLHHALRNATVPLLTVAGIMMGGLITGTIVVENIFNIQGLGRIAVTSIAARDYPVTMGIVLLFTLFYGTINLLVDIAYVLVDPRIRLAVS
ncbi:peptide/nickel transport system permease protein [Devosia enhydra]|uniref:Peptide/nickel transport system permease protein n=1 Tax=Devosia enhydra TaxID=665118 RepID=A0A1K2HYD1_9HYPH|nr:ABC transporter permease [Devosia enhydra]SFZ84563.1 peptide/nickel transport system permease protein [Devosia enhydra]